MTGYAIPDVRMLDVAKGVIIAVEGCSSEQAFAKLVEVAEDYGLGVLTVAQALVTAATSKSVQPTENVAVNAAIAAWGDLLMNRRRAPL